ncbi:MAG: hypothetical protein ACKOYN_05465 [Planctomycetota bacterium]
MTFIRTMQLAMAAVVVPALGGAAIVLVDSAAWAQQTPAPATQPVQAGGGQGEKPAPSAAGATGASSAASGEAAPSTGSSTVPGSAPPNTTPPVAEAPKPAPPKSLDDLLGVPAGGGDRSAEDAAEREQAERLQRSLDEASLQDLVARALDGMKTASGRLTEKRDAGLGTQRIQEEVVLTLDRLLEEAQRQQQQQQQRSSSSSSSRSQRQQQSDPSEQSQQQSQQQRQRQQRQQGQQPGSSESGEAEPPPSEEGVAGGGELSESRIEWGRLPERVRDLVLQGRRDKVSSLYERLTREYYRRLAEEASK